jgi:hypothetical protein
MKIYCNQLGMLVEFSYCTSMNESLPCRNIIGCWKGRTDVISFLKKSFSAEELKKVFSGPPKTRLSRIVESLEKPE